MITKDITRLIYNCYTEIEEDKEMIDELKSKLVDNWHESNCLERRTPHEKVSYGIDKVPFIKDLNVIN